MIPQISVIVPCYNSQKYIQKCINSILSQSFNNFELILVNDCSKDNTLEIIQKYAKKDNRIKIINHLNNQGSHNARLSGINIAKGEYIAFIDSDDYVAKDYLSNLYINTENKKIDLIISSDHFKKFKFIKVRKRDIPQYNANLIDKIIQNPHKTNLAKGFFGVSQFPCYMWMKLYRRQLLQELPKLDIFQNEDVLINMTLFKKIKTLKIINYCGYYYRKGGGSSSNERYMSDFKKVYLYKKNALKYWEFSDKFNPYIYILIELKNCFYEYLIRYLLMGKSDGFIIIKINKELKDNLYSEFNYLKHPDLNLYNSEEIQAILHKDANKIITIAKNKISLKRRINYLLSKIL